MAEILGEDVMPENRAAPRRKFTEDHDVALLKELIACGAHVSRRGSQMDKFEEVSAALNNGGAFPWMTDAKHCLDRYKLLLSTFRRLDKVRASASGTEEELNEKDQLLSDISVAVDDANERGRSDRLEQAKRDKELQKAGEKIRYQAMNRRKRIEKNDLAGVEPGFNNSPSVEEIIENPMEPVETNNLAEVSNVSTESRKKKRKTVPIDLEETLRLSEAKRAEQVDQRLELDRDRLEFEQARAEKLDVREYKRLELMSSQNDLQQQQQRDNAMMQMKMMSVMEEILKKFGR